LLRRTTLVRKVFHRTRIREKENNKLQSRVCGPMGSGGGRLLSPFRGEVKQHISQTIIAVNLMRGRATFREKDGLGSSRKAAKPGLCC